MVFRDILLVFDTYPDPTPPSAMDDALAIAQALGARISALACAIMLPSTGNILADTLLDMPTILVEEGGEEFSETQRPHCRGSDERPRTAAYSKKASSSVFQNRR